MTSRLRSVPRRRGAYRRFVLLVVASVVVAGLALPAAGSAAVTIGATGGSATADCPPNFTWAQDSSAVGSPSYVVPPGGGVITSWSHDRGPASATAQLRLKVFRKTGPDTYLTVGQSDFETLTAAGVNTFATRVQVEGGDLAGFRLAGANTSCRRSGSTGDVAVASGPGQPDPPIGSSIFLTSTGAFLLNLSATVEPDCDGDGFGDETQDPELPLGAACGKGNRTLTLDANKNKVKKGKRVPRVRLTGRISSAARQGPCETGQAVELQRKRPKQAAFTTFAQRQTDAQGSFSLKEKVKKTFEFRAQVVETAACTPALSNSEKVKVKKRR
jgi:hypothetical protein